MIHLDAQQPALPINSGRGYTYQTMCGVLASPMHTTYYHDHVTCTRCLVEVGYSEAAAQAIAVAKALLDPDDITRKPL